MSDITWIDGPPPNHGNSVGRVAAIVKELKAKPGVWAIVETNARASRVAIYKAQGCEAVSRKTPEQAATFGDIYARWPVT